MKKIKTIVWFFFRVIKVAIGSFYDLWRVVFYGALYEDNSKEIVRGYATVRTYHTLEKSLSFGPRFSESNRAKVNTLLDYIDTAIKSRSVSFFDVSSLNVLHEYLFSPNIPNSLEVEVLRERLYDSRMRIDTQLSRSEYFRSDIKHGAYDFQQLEELLREDQQPEMFFQTRRSVRFYRQQIVEDALYERAVRMAMQSPSASNRQPWAIYHTSDPKVRDIVLSLQSGNSGFGSQVPNLAIVTVDLRAYMSGEERSAHFVDGALFASSFIYALHALGIGSCCLNWSRMPKQDKALRERVNISPHHAIIMLVGFGYPLETGKVCCSVRRPLDDILFELKDL